MTRHFLFGRARAEESEKPQSEAEKEPIETEEEAKGESPDDSTEDESAESDPEKKEMKDESKPDPDCDKAEAAARKKERAECVAIANHCKIFGRPELASEYLAKGYSAAEVQKILLKARDTALKTETETATISGKQTGKRGGLAENMRQRFKTKN